MKKLGVFGGAFNPPHIAHSIAANFVKQELSLDKILFVPTGRPALKESIEPEHRLAMSKLAFGNDKNFEVSDIEMHDREMKSYTINTLNNLISLYKVEEIKIFLIIGMDNLIDFPKWKEPEKLFELSEVIVMNRPDYSIEKTRLKFAEKAKFVNVPFLEISSSMIRTLIKNGKSIKYLVCNEVDLYIKENNLYL